MDVLSSGDTRISVKYVGFSGDPSDNIYISGLPLPCVDASTLKELFMEAGFTVVRSKSIPDTRGSGCSFAMVQFSSIEGASAAKDLLNGRTCKEVGLTALTPTTKIALAPTTKIAGILPGLMLKYSGDGNVPSNNLYIAGLPSPSIEQAALEEMFTAHGLTVVRSKVIPDTKGFGQSAAMVQLASVSEASYAISKLGEKAKTIASPAPVGAPVLKPVPKSGTVVSPPARRHTQGGIEPPTKRQRTSVETFPMLVKFKGDDEMSETLYIKGLPSPQVEESFLQEAFQALGMKVQWTRIFSDTINVGVSAAMVELSSVEEASNAIIALNGKFFVDWERELQEIHGTGQAGNANESKARQQIDFPLMVKFKGENDEPSETLYVKGLPSPAVEPAALEEVFHAIGAPVQWSRIIPDTKGWGVSAAMVQVGSVDEATSAIATLNGKTWSQCCESPIQEATNPFTKVKEMTKGAPAQSFDQVDLARGAEEVGFEAGVEIGAPLAVVDNQLTENVYISGLPSGVTGTPLAVKYVGAENQPSDNVYISGLPSPFVDQRAFTSIFSSLGLSIVRSKLIPDTRGIGTSAALVQLRDQSEAEMAIEFLTGQDTVALGLFRGTSVVVSSAVGSQLPKQLQAVRPVGAPVGVFSKMPNQTSRPLLMVKFSGVAGLPSDNLYIAGLPSPQVDELELQTLVEQMGVRVVRSKVIPDTKGSGTSAAMLQLSSVEEAQAVMTHMNGHPCPLAAAPISGAAFMNSPGVLYLKYAGYDSTPSDNLYVTGLPSPQVDTEVLTRVFSGLHLTVVRMKIIPDTKGFGCSAAMVQLASMEEASAAIEALQGQCIDPNAP